MEDDTVILTVREEWALIRISLFSFSIVLEKKCIGRID